MSDELTQILDRYELTCSNCGCQPYFQYSYDQQQHLKRCSNWNAGFDCMHYEDNVQFCNCYNNEEI